MKTIWIVIAFAVLGGGLGYFLGLPPKAPVSESPNAAIAPVNDDAGTITEEEPESRPGAASRPSIADIRREAAETTALPKKAVDRLIAEATAGLEMEGEGLIRGRVLDKRNRPLAGVLVRLQGFPETLADPDRPSRSSGVPYDPSIDEQLRQAIRSEWGGRLLRREMTTGNDGKFSFDGIAKDRSFSLTAFAEGMRFQVGWNETVVSVEAGADVTFVGRPSSVLPVKVEDEDGKGVEGAWINVSQKNGAYLFSEWWAPGSPEISVVEGDLSMVASLEKDDRTEGEKTDLSFPVEDESKLPIKLVVKRQTGVDVSVSFDPGEAAPILVQLVSTATKMPGDAEIIHGERGEWTDVTRGKAVFRDIGDGGSYVVALVRAQAVLARQNIEVPKGQVVKVQMSVPSPKAQDFVAVRIFDPNGAILRDCNCWDTGKGGEVIRRPDGTFWIERYSNRNEDLSPGDLPAESTISVESAAYGRKSVTYSPATASEVVVRFERPAQLTVIIDGYQGSAIEGRASASVMVETKTKNEDGSENTNTDNVGRYTSDADSRARGIFTWSGIQPTKATIVLSVSAGNAGQQQLAKQEVDLHAGPNEIHFKAPPLCTVTVTTSGAAPHATISMNKIAEDEGEGWGYAQAEINDQGRAVFEHLAPGTYQIATWNQEGEVGTLIATIEQSTSIHYDVKPANALRIPKQIRRSKALIDLGFQEGDLLVGTAQDEWKSNPHSALESIYGSDEPVVMRVLRNGAPMEITVEPKAFNKAVRETWLVPMTR